VIRRGKKKSVAAAAWAERRQRRSRKWVGLRLNYIKSLGPGGGTQWVEGWLGEGGPA